MEAKKLKFKAFIRVVKSLYINDYDTFGTLEVIREPLIHAKDKKEVKEILLEKYPQFFQNGKVYEKSTKDQAQFFYVVIFPLYNHEVELINEGEWVCDYCGQTHENKYINRPIISRKFEGKMFCNRVYDENSGINNSTVDNCYDLWKKDKFKNEDLPDNLNYINTDSINYIYKCTEKATDKSYIGKTRNAPFFRWWNHLTHSGSPFGIYLRQTKLSEWSFEVLEELPAGTSDKEVFRIETEYMLKFDSVNNGFNSVVSNKKTLEISGNLFDEINK